TTFTDATGTMTASYSFDTGTGTGAINYSYTLTTNTSGDNTSASFAVAVTDADGDSAPAGNLVIKIVDDVPTATTHTATVQEGTSVGTVDVVFIVDISGSMGLSGGGGVGFDVPGFSDDRIGLARYSMQQLLTNHPEIQNVQITRFSDSANTQ